MEDLIIGIFNTHKDDILSIQQVKAIFNAITNTETRITKIRGVVNKLVINNQLKSITYDSYQLI